MLTEVFIPWRWILNATEYFTPLAYPYFAAEQKVRGTNFLMFTQTAGSDILIFSIGTALVCLIVQNLLKIYSSHKLESESRLYIIGVSTIILSALPLLFIALYAPGWAYVTFLDSRHLYLGSFGAALLVGYYLTKVRDLSNKATGVLLIIISVWASAQYFTLQNELQTFSDMGKSRNKIIDTVLRDVPKIPNQISFLVSSDTGYYGFGPIPPFQTNLGQILMIQYYVRNQLSDDFLHDSYFGKATLNTQQTLSYGKQKFGYYVTTIDFVIGAIDHAIPIDQLYAYKWIGKDNSLLNISPEVREKVMEKKKALAAYENWNSYTMKNLPLTIQAPPGTQFIQVKNLPDHVDDAVKIHTLTKDYEVRVHTSTANIGQFEDLSYLPDSTGKLLGNRNYVKGILSQYSDPVTTKISTEGPNMNYYTPIIVPKKIVELVVYKEPSADAKVFAPAEEIISLIRYRPDKKE